MVPNQLQIGEPHWMPELRLGIGRSPYQDGDVQRQALYWYDERGNRYLTPEETARQAQQQLERYRQRFGELPED